MGERGRERVRSHFAPEVMCEALDALYSGLLGLPAPSEAGRAGGCAAGARSGRRRRRMPRDARETAPG